MTARDNVLPRAVTDRAYSYARLQFAPKGVVEAGISLVLATSKR